MLKHPMYRHRPRPWITNPIKGSMHLPEDCADLSAIDWTPLADTNSTVDTPTAAHSKGKQDRNSPRATKRPAYEKTTRKRTAIHTSEHLEATC